MGLGSLLLLAHSSPVLWQGPPCLLYFTWVVDVTKCIVVPRVCVSVCLSVPHRILILLHRPGCNLGNGRGCCLVVHYWADLQSVHRFRCCDNIARTRNVSECLYSLLCLVSLAFHFGNAHGSGPRGGQEHPSCSPAGFQQPRSCDWISFCPSWEQFYPANSWIYVRYWCWRRSLGLASSICCRICPAGRRLAWPWILGVPLFLLCELSAGPCWLQKALQ